MIIMSVLMVGALVLSVVVVNTTGIVVPGRNEAQSRAAADAGIVAAVAAAAADDDVCSTTVPDSDVAPVYKVDVSCDGDRVLIESTGTAPDGRTETKVAAEYALVVESVQVTDPSITPTGLVLWEAAEMGQVNLKPVNGNRPQIVIPNGSFLCRLTVPGNVLVKNNITSTDSCHIGGDLWAGGVVSFDGGTTSVAGDVLAAGTGLSTIVASVGDPARELSQLRTNGSLNLKWNGGHVHANVFSRGDVAVNDRKVDGAVHVPAGKKVSFGSGGAATGGVIEAVIPQVDTPDLPGWFDYAYKESDWPGYDVVKLRNTSDNSADTCRYFNEHTGWNVNGSYVGGGNRGWSDLSKRVKNVVIDGRACDQLTSDAGGSPTATLGVNIVLLAKKFNLTGLTMKAVTSATPKVWFITEDTSADGKPTCPLGTGVNFEINGAKLKGVTSTIYSPCVVAARGGGEITGSLYSRGFKSGSTLTINGELMGLPSQPPADGGDGGAVGIPTGKRTLGALISRQDSQ